MPRDSNDYRHVLVELAEFFENLNSDLNFNTKKQNKVGDLFRQLKNTLPSESGLGYRYAFH